MKANPRRSTEERVEDKNPFQSLHRNGEVVQVLAHLLTSTFLIGDLKPSESPDTRCKISISSKKGPSHFGNGGLQCEGTHIRSGCWLSETFQE